MDILFVMLLVIGAAVIAMAARHIYLSVKERNSLDKDEEIAPRLEVKARPEPPRLRFELESKEGAGGEPDGNGTLAFFPLYSSEVLCAAAIKNNAVADKCVVGETGEIYLSEKAKFTAASSPPTDRHIAEIKYDGGFNIMVYCGGVYRMSRGERQESLKQGTPKSVGKGDKITFKDLSLSLELY